MVTNTQKVLVQESFAAVMPIADDAAALFYRRLFELDPSLERMFKGDMAEQRRKLMQMLTAVEDDWRRAITAIAVPMLEGAAVHTAMVAERLSEE